jgi:hypothetical protein
MMMQLAFSISAMLFVCSSGNHVTFIVDEEVDSPAFSLDCAQGSPCSVRSAWAACQNSSITSCTIILQDYTFYSMDSVYGALELHPEDHIALQGGRGSVLLGSGTQLISYDYYQYDSVAPGVFPSLTMVDLAVVGFGSLDAFGGALKVYGDGQFTIQNVNFLQNYANTGGAVFISGSTIGVSIMGCTFQANYADQNGGAISLDGDNRNVTIVDSTLTDNQAGNLGGAVFIGYYNENIDLRSLTIDGGQASFGGAVLLMQGNRQVTIANTEVTSCSAINFGGAVYLLADNIDITVSDSVFADCSAQAGGAVFMHQDNEQISFARTQFDTCSARGDHGGAISLYMGNSHVNVTDSSFTDCTANVNGGALYMNSMNTHINIAGTNFSSCSAAQFGGALFVESRSSDIAVADSQFEHCEAIAGGAVLIFMYNEDVSLLRTRFDQCSSWGDHGGAIDIYMYNSRIEYTDCAFTDCAANGNGGGLYLNGYNTEVSVVDTTFTRCSAKTGGGAVHAELQNHNLLLRDTWILSCTAGFGGGLYLAQSNTDVTIDNCWFDHCLGTYRGGAINADAFNDNMMVVDTLITSCESQFGGGIFSSRNYNLRIFESELRDCRVDSSGGGLLLYAENRQVSVVNTTFDSNIAAAGAGIASFPQSRGLAIAGCHFLNNWAYAGDGGAVVLTGGNEQFLITDSFSATRLQVIESEHPYENTAPDGVILNRTVSDPEALGFVLHFDADSALGSEDQVAVYNQQGEEVFYVGFDGFWAGRELPPVRLEGNSFNVLMTGTGYSKPPTSKADNLYGFRLYVAPIMQHPGRATVFEYNNAHGRGGALHAAFSLSFAVITNAHFSYNSAQESGGAVSLRSAATGITIANVVFEENASMRDGGALYVESGAGGFAVKDCTFLYNTAANGGATAFTVSNGRPGLVLMGSTSMAFENCGMLFNSAETRGGAMYLDSDNEVSVRGGVFNYNDATSGGAFYAGSANLLTIADASIVSNRVTTNGGGLALGADNEVTLTDAHFIGNFAGKTPRFLRYYRRRVYHWIY